MTDRRTRPRRDRHPPRATTSVCPDCGKIRYLTRADAKSELNRAGWRNRVYRCGDFWHTASWKPQEQVAFFRRIGTNHQDAG